MVSSSPLPVQITPDPPTPNSTSIAPTRSDPRELLASMTNLFYSGVHGYSDSVGSSSESKLPKSKSYGCCWRFEPDSSSVGRQGKAPYEGCSSDASSRARDAHGLSSSDDPTRGSYNWQIALYSVPDNFSFQRRSIAARTCDRACRSLFCSSAGPGYPPRGRVFL